ncbi:class I SAM-dependent methyltransferase [Pelagovum pacificum]|uniref:Class I SAM-dependent methyltransferase n=1 Tax=Pelagovum pacificum TaxID=2588711 RepID=A0A5C5GDE8_9RHOB|nr:class I SAM-dependent methyltransferase [Pelagovum pacificum]QQA44049.1 class I SAM-dependent methyltransferase [Pelagovum pacificum]TNY32822.1 class I SAM-dependent methyltransferase [Pelagovum pacificum]
MNGFFDFLADIPPYEDSPTVIDRLNKRHEMFIAPFAEEIAGARVLDLAAHDGRWSHAFAGAGAREVTGIEGRQELVDRYAHYPSPELKAHVSLRTGDIFDGMEDLVKAGETFDVVGVLGIFYHIMDHFRLLRLASLLKPKLIIIDSEFSLRPGPLIMLSRERTAKDLNAIEQVEGQETAVIGIPSRAATEVMADVLGYSCEWLDWEGRRGAARKNLADYYRPERKRRGTCILRPRRA